MTALPNPFDPNSTATSPRAVEQADALLTLPASGASAAPSDPALSVLYGPNLPAAASITPAAAGLLENDIPEIFRVANLLCEVDRFTPDEEAIYSAALDEFAARAFEGDPTWADPAPLFLNTKCAWGSK